MKTTIVGYPRIGSLRELKFAEEKYFRKEITAAELEKAAEKLRLENLDVQRQSGLDLIPSNDFSYYDGMLDTAVLSVQFLQDIPPLDFLHSIHILQWQEDIRAARAT